MDEVGAVTVLEQSDQEKLSETGVVRLPPGLELCEEDLYSITAAEKSKFFVIAGATGSGKTTLVTSIYHFFLSGKFYNSFVFSGSRTLAAFEKRAYPLRAISQSSHADMQRTPRGSIDSILHLRVTPKDGESTTNMLFSDFSGEDFEAVLGDVEAATEEFQIIRKTSCLVFLLDGEKISSKKYRYSEVEQAINVLQTFWDGGLIRKTPQIVLIVSKYDLIKSKLKGDPSLETFMSGILDSIIERLPGIKGKCIFQCIASMPDDESELSAFYGLSELMEILIRPPEHKDYKFIKPPLTSQFNLWKERRI